MTNTVRLNIDGKEVEVSEGTLLISAAAEAGVDIPHFCYHKKLSLTSSCRMCLVEVDGLPRPVPACITRSVDGMNVHTHSENVRKAQKAVMEFLLINHPLDCPVCDQGGECRLQDISFSYGITESRYTEEKRVVLQKDVGPLISMMELSRCIHCARCIRFSEEIAGVRELGMIKRGEKSEITTFLGKAISSELSGNMIDLCPVGALTSKPFRYKARAWELSQKRSISPHDGVGANLIVQTKDDKVMRVLPLENEDVNECWISDKDRFSYEALNGEERLKKPMIKQGGVWRETDWATALAYVAHAVKDVTRDYGADSLGIIASPHSTLEELSLLNKFANGLGTKYINALPRQTDFSLTEKIKPWLGISISKLFELDEFLLIGSFLRKDHPLLATRIRHAVNRGAHVSVIHAVDDDFAFPVTHKVICKPSLWETRLAELAFAVAEIKNVAPPDGLSVFYVSDDTRKIAERLLSEKKIGIFLGNAAAWHPEAGRLHIWAEWIAENTNAYFGYLTEAADAVGVSLAGIRNKDVFEKTRQAYFLFNVEPDLDTANPLLARNALKKAKTVAVFSAFRHSTDIADALLPIAPFTETSGTFVNCSGLAQSFNAAVSPLAETRQGSGVLIALGALLDLDMPSSLKELRNEITKGNVDVSSLLKNKTGIKPVWRGTDKKNGLERVADVPIYFADILARRAPSLQKTWDSRLPQANMNPKLMEKLFLSENDTVKITANGQSAFMRVCVNPRLAEDVVGISAAHPLTAPLGSMFGKIEVEKA